MMMSHSDESIELLIRARHEREAGIGPKRMSMKAYLMLLIDTRPIASLPDKPNVRRVAADIYSDSNPSMDCGCRVLPIADDEGADFGEATNKLLDRIDAEGSPYAWVRPLLSARSRAEAPPRHAHPVTPTQPDTAKPACRAAKRCATSDLPVEVGDTTCDCPPDDEDEYEGSWREAADNEGARIAAESRESSDE